MNSDSALMRGVRTGIQAIIGFAVGLVATLWAVPGVPMAFHTYVTGHALQLALTVGVPSALAGFVWNALRPSVKNF